jgi:hypothetical protein
MQDARLLHIEFEAIHHISLNEEEAGEILAKLDSIAAGNVSAAVKRQPQSVRGVARDIRDSPGRCLELIIDDFNEIITWEEGRSSSLTNDERRERLVRRKALLQAALPPNLRQHADDAMRHVERERLKKKYVNSETMLKDSIDDIPKHRFFVSEDNYAWDMSELAQCLEVNDGVMRNPLSRQMFSEDDIRRIMAHPLAQQLKPLQLAQRELKKGVRPQTIERVAKLGSVMLADQSADMAPSREAIDEFLGYIATLPDSEQKTVNALKIPAKDRTGQPFDYTIGESVRDAKANTTCFHKVGHIMFILICAMPANLGVHLELEPGTHLLIQIRSETF